METNIGPGLGYHQFIFHSSLSYNSTTNTEYLQDDCLRLRVKTVVLYSTPLFLKTPAWQDPLTASQSLCEFTVTEFTKRKHFSNTFYSPPFYTHPQGYKMCLRVDANGFGSGKGTHVSIFASLMRGEHDDQLQWPFEGDVIVELMNWKRNRRHHKHTIHFYYYPGESESLNAHCVRVTEGDISEHSFGCPEFISHCSLSYNHITNTEYLQDDCVRVSVTVHSKHKPCVIA